MPSTHSRLNRLFRLLLSNFWGSVQNGFDNPKPIIAIQPWDIEKTSSVVKSAANCVVGWNTNSIVTDIKELG